MDYKPMYYRLFHAITDAIYALETPSGARRATQILKKAQDDSEALFAASTDAEKSENKVENTENKEETNIEE